MKWMDTADRRYEASTTKNGAAPTYKGIYTEAAPTPNIGGPSKDCICVTDGGDANWNWNGHSSRAQDAAYTLPPEDISQVANIHAALAGRCKNSF